MRTRIGYRAIGVRGGAVPNSRHLEGIIRTLRADMTSTLRLRCPKDEHSAGQFVLIRKKLDSEWKDSFKRDTT